MRRLSIAGVLGFVLLGPVASAQDERPRLVAQVGSHSGYYECAFSPDGRFLAVAARVNAAILWEVATGREIRRFLGHSRAVRAVSFSPDGRYLLTGSEDGTARIWDVATGREIRSYVPRLRQVLSAVFSPNGSRIAVAGWPEDDGASPLVVLDVRTTEPVFTAPMNRGFRFVSSVAFSPDGRTLFAGDEGYSARLWDLKTGKEVRRIVTPCDPGRRYNEGPAVAFSPDGSEALVGARARKRSSSEGFLGLYETETGRLVRRFEGLPGSVNSVAVSPDGTRVLAGSPGEKQGARMWDLRTGRQVFTTPRSFRWSKSVTFSSDGSRFAVVGRPWIGVWETATGRPVLFMRGLCGLVGRIRIAPDGRWCATTGWKGPSLLWDLAGDTEVRRLAGDRWSVHAAAFTPDSRWLVTGSSGGGVFLWDVERGELIRRFEGHKRFVEDVDISPDGSRLLTASRDETIRLWDVVTGEEIARFPGASSSNCACFGANGRSILASGFESGERTQGWRPGRDANHLVQDPWDETRIISIETGEVLRRIKGHAHFSPGERWLVTSEFDGGDYASLLLRDPGTGRVVHRLEGHTHKLGSWLFTPDGEMVVTSSHDATIRLWNLETFETIRTLKGHTGGAYTLALLPGRNLLLSGGWDGPIRLWDLETGKELLRLVAFIDGSWAVVDSEGRYDASNGGDVEGLHWVIGKEPISLDQLKDRYYEPGLLAKILGFNKEPLREVKAFTTPKLHPSFELDPPTAERQALTIRLKNRGGGIGRVVVNINGKELTADARAAVTDPDAEELSLEVPLSGDPRLRPGEKNVIEVLAFNAEGYLRSRGFTVEYTPPGEAGRGPTELWAVVAGISDYAGAAIDLKFAAKDAADFALGLRTAAQRLFGAEKTHVTLLEDAGRKELIAALREAARAKPKDILVLYLAGHGVSQDDAYYYLTKEARSAELKDPAIRETTALSSHELTELVKKIPALKQVLILDTCASGRFVEKLTESREIPSSQIRALERIKDRTGLHILAGCAADRVSYEATRYGQGLLTYSLLLAMKAGKLRAEEYVDVSTLFNFAADKVPEFAKDIGGVQRPIVAAPRGGGSFDIGRLTEQDRKKLTLRSVRPLFTRSSFFDQEEADDLLGLEKEVDAVLAGLTARGRDAPLVFVDVRQAPDAYRIAGTYTTSDGRTSVRFKLRRGEEASDWVEVKGAADDLAALAKNIVAEVRKRIE
jgi:WD40 repeat protein